ncbi:ABC transporter ATP-binding protein [Deltaproteobacteria bacterium Smac51]|nr:ABC transporter ATP-binding protein [Deltaproteobacteria bacterium Smac51]
MSAAISKSLESGLAGRQLSFRYDRKLPWLFRGLDISIAPGEAVGLTGPSGAGKSTLAQILAGFIKPLSGSLMFNDKPLPQKGFSPVQYIYQHPQLAVNPRWTGGQIVAEAFQPSEELLDMLEISADWLNRYPHELSGGELQRMAVARALGPETKCLLADELSAMLDPLTQALIWRTLINYKNKGLSLLVISHDRHLMTKVCDRMLPLKRFDQP